MRLLIMTLVLVVISNGVNSQDWIQKPDFPEELGYVNWSRSYDDAIDEAEKKGKPVFILFQEVPGCATCRNYGNNLLTHPHVVEALETYFVPLAIYNNKSGADSKILRKFNEPSWNNPVARIIDPTSEKDIVRRLNGRYDMQSLISMISNGIIESRQIIPEYLHLLYQEVVSNAIKETHLAMYCFWTGEKQLGLLDGVVSTKAGFMNGTEVVKVQYDANKLSEKELISYASERQCADAVYSNNEDEIDAAKALNIRTQYEGKFRPDSEPKYYLSKSDWKSVPMTALQSLKVNAAIANNQPFEKFLSPRQIELNNLLKSNKTSSKKRMINRIDLDFAKEWNTNVLE